MAISTISAAPSRRLPVRAALIGGAVVAAAVAAGAAAAGPRPLAMLPVAVLLGGALLVSPRWRFLFVIAGGLATLQSSDTLTLTKMAYLAGAAVALSAILSRNRQLEAEPAYRLFRPVVLAFMLLAATVIIAILNALAHGIPLVSAFRDGAPYLMFAAIPFFAFDMARAGTHRMAVAIFVVAGLLTSASFAVEWLGRRGLTDLSLSRVALPSFLLPAALFSYAMSAALQGRRHRLVWLAAGAVVLALLLVTGTRLSLVLLLAPLVITASMHGPIDVKLMRLVVLIGVLGALAVLAIVLLAGATRIRQEQLVERFSSIRSLVEQPATDNSYRDRASQARSVWQAFRENPVWGTGPGFSFNWVGTDGEPQHSFAMDIGLAVPAKFGVVGVFVVLVVFAACVAFSRRLRHRPESAVARGALNSYLIILALWFLFGSPFEDKGTSFGLLCLLTLCLATIHPQD